MESQYLSATGIIDSDHPAVGQYASQTTGRSTDPIEVAVKLYYAVRDGIWYDPYYPFYLPEHYRASNVLRSGRGYCVSKAALLCALGRACGIPSRIRFADVRNHLATRQLIDFLGNDLFVYHAMTEFYLAGKWVKSTPAFNSELCERHRVAPLEFNGREDSIFHAYNREKKQFMEYLTDHGTYGDIPVALIVTAWEKAYGKNRVSNWIALHEKSEGKSLSDFSSEEVWKRKPNLNDTANP